MLYRDLFEKYFPERSDLIPHFWMPRGVNEIINPSATVHRKREVQFWIFIY